MVEVEGTVLIGRPLRPQETGLEVHVNRVLSLFDFLLSETLDFLDVRTDTGTWVFHLTV